MALKKLLIANRGEIAVRVARAAADLGIVTVAIHAEDDAASLHVHLADEVLPLSGHGVSAYLDGPQVVRLARQAGCDAIHPGYGSWPKVRPSRAPVQRAGCASSGRRSRRWSCSATSCGRALRR